MESNKNLNTLLRKAPSKTSNIKSTFVLQNNLHMKLYFLFSLLILASCANENKKLEGEFEFVTHTISYAEHFQLSKKDGEMVLTILNPDNGKVQHTFKKSDFNQQQLPTIIALSSTHIGMLEKLNKAEFVKGISNIDYVANATVKTNFTKGKVIALGEESNIPLEQVVASKAKIIMYSGFGKSFPHQQQLEQLGIVCMPNYDWRENHPLGKAEWIKVFGFIYNCETAANDYFSKLEKEYLQLVEKAAKLTVSKPLMSGNVFGDAWYTPAGESYNALLFKDAHIAYHYSKTTGTGSLSLNLEKVLSENIQCAYWINPGAGSLKELSTMNPKAKLFDAFKSKRVYCYTKSGNNFWEMSAIEPHHVLSDLIQITHPEVELNNKLYFYSQLE